ncbi:MAG: N-acetylglucosamine-6-phosphate deacetylase [Acidimicrobiia bacterium]|nr:N-acetylglucosamine-6-phosphate deacetylase [Acidimicrobiia bacterium]
MTESRQEDAPRTGNAPGEPTTVLAGGQVLTPAGWVETDVTLSGGRIASVSSAGSRAVGSVIVEVGGLHVVPGLVDIQINGGFGHDFTQNPETIWDVGKRLPEHGVTAFLPTVITSPEEMITNAMGVMNEGPPGGYKGAIPIGLHLEGPLLSQIRSGTHDTRYLRSPTAVTTDAWSPEEGVRMVTLAPELPGALELIEALAEQGVVVSLGHSNATYDDALAGFQSGATVGTHLYNAMSALHHRDPGLVGALLAEREIVAEIIADGIHTHPAAVRIAWEAKKPDHLVLVTDAMAAMGMGRGRFVISSVDVLVDGTGPRNADGVLAGSALTMDQAIRNLIAFTDCSLGEAIATATANPARTIGDPGRGVLEEGARADITVLGPDLDVELTLVGGTITHRRPS